MACAPIVVSTDFVEACIEENQLVHVEDYLLKDAEGENRYSLQLREVLQRAKQNEGSLLRHHTILVTENVHGGFDTFKSIIEANGGKCLLYKGRAGSLPTPRAGDEEESDMGAEPESVYLISGATSQEVKLWPKFRQMGEDAGLKPRIVRTDWLLDLALSQQIKWDDMYKMTDDDIKV